MLMAQSLSLLSFNRNFIHHHGLVRFIHGAGWNRSDLIDDIHAVDNFAKNRVAVVQMRRRAQCNEKLTTIGTGAGIGHGKDAGTVVSQRWIKFIFEAITRSAHTGTLGAPPLNNKSGYNSVKGQTVIKITLTVSILTAFSQRHLVERARDAGALAYVTKPYQRADLVAAIEVALGRFRELQDLDASVRGLEEQLATRKIVDRAKGRLMDERSMSESEAFGFIQRAAMQDRTTMRAGADKIMDGSLPEPG